MPVSSMFNKVEPGTSDAGRLERIYIVSGVFMLVGLLQLTFIRAVDFDMAGCVPVPSFMWLVITLVCYFLLVFTELFDKYPINWTLGIVALESMTLCVACYNWNSLKMAHAAIVVLTVVMINFCLYLMGAFLPVVVLPNYNCMLVSTIAFILGYIFLVILVHALQKPSVAVIILDTWSLLYMIPLTLYASTLIHQRRLINLMSQEYMLSATIIATFVLYMIHIVTAIVTHSLRLQKSK